MNIGKKIEKFSLFQFFLSSSVKVTRNPGHRDSSPRVGRKFRVNAYNSTTISRS